MYPSAATQEARGIVSESKGPSEGGRVITHLKKEEFLEFSRAMTGKIQAMFRVREATENFEDLVVEDTESDRSESGSSRRC